MDARLADNLPKVVDLLLVQVALGQFQLDSSSSVENVGEVLEVVPQGGGKDHDVTAVDKAHVPWQSR